MFFECYAIERAHRLLLFFLCYFSPEFCSHSYMWVSINKRGLLLTFFEPKSGMQLHRLTTCVMSLTCTVLIWNHWHEFGMSLHELRQGAHWLSSIMWTSVANCSHESVYKIAHKTYISGGAVHLLRLQAYIAQDTNNTFH